LTKTQFTKGSDKVKAKAMQARKQAMQARQQARKQAMQAQQQARKQAMQARQQARRAASQAAPYAATARVTARRSVHSMRAWAAPRLEQSGQALQERVAPRMSAMLSSAARRIEPPRRAPRRWPFLVAGLVTLGAAAGAAVWKMRGSGLPWQQSKPSEEAAEASPSAGPSGASSDASAAQSNARAHSH
jgi:hypothetical protein